MQASGTGAPVRSQPIGVRVYRRWMRPAFAAAQAVAAVNWFAAAVLLARAAAFARVALPPAGFALEVVLVSVVPFGVASLLRRRERGQVVAASGAVTVTTARRRVEVPLASIASARVWRAPLPGTGASLRMRSGQPFPWAIESDDPGAIVAAVAAASGDGWSGGRAASWAAARHARRPGRVERLVRWVVEPLAIGAVLFRADQLITTGDAFGAWHVHGPAAALRGFAAYVVAALASLVVLSGAARTAGELACAAWTALSPRHAQAARIAAEWMSRFAVYVVPPALLAIRFFG
jgi:apolipoprotein N-acyltransferase